MKLKLLLFLSLLFTSLMNGQCGQIPPPAGIWYVYGLDTDNDGFAIFDIQYFIDHSNRPHLESFFGVSSSGYTATFKDRNFVVQPFLYTNTTQNEECGIEYTYSGSGPVFEEQPPCFWPVGIYLGAALQLITVPYNGDQDNDGILNVDEDSNRNGNLMDDDDDRDGIINLLDNVINLSIEQPEKIELKIFPNPVTNGVLNIESTSAITSVAVFDLTGKPLLHADVVSNAIPVDRLADGIYLLKLDSGQGCVYKKIAVNR